MATWPVQWRTVSKGGDPKTDHVGTTRTPGWHPEETEALTATREVRGVRQYEKGRGPKDPPVRREGTREPRRHFAQIMWSSDFWEELRPRESLCTQS